MLPNRKRGSLLVEAAPVDARAEPKNFNIVDTTPQTPGDAAVLEAVTLIAAALQAGDLSLTLRDKACLVLRLFSPRRLNLKEIVGVTGLPRETARRRAAALSDVMVGNRYALTAAHALQLLGGGRHG